jgi:hypothetical protein
MNIYDLCSKQPDIGPKIATSQLIAREKHYFPLELGLNAVIPDHREGFFN